MLLDSPPAGKSWPFSGVFCSLFFGCRRDRAGGEARTSRPLRGMSLRATHRVTALPGSFVIGVLGFCLAVAVWRPRGRTEGAEGSEGPGVVPAAGQGPPALPRGQASPQLSSSRRTFLTCSPDHGQSYRCSHPQLPAVSILYIPYILYIIYMSPYILYVPVLYVPCYLPPCLAPARGPARASSWPLSGG